jgi:Esterase/lipase
VLKYRTAGIRAFITYYRNVAGGNRFPYMFRDIQRTIQLIRKRSKVYDINPNALGVMGFSAGGHLAMSAGIYYNHNYLEEVGIKTDISLRPDFVVPIYPVVTLQGPYAHKRSVRGVTYYWEDE